MARGLESNYALTRLALSHNAIADSGATALATALHANSSLRVLELRFNAIGDAGALALARALRVNRGLARLCVRDNLISYAAVLLPDERAPTLRSEREAVEQSAADRCRIFSHSII